MHEVSIANEIIGIVKQNLPDSGVIRVKSVRLELGEFSNIMPDALRFGFDVLTTDTELALSELIIDIIPLSLKCSDCGQISPTEPGFFYCSNCGSNNVTIESGQEMKVIAIDIEEEVYTAP